MDIMVKAIRAAFLSLFLSPFTTLAEVGDTHSVKAETAIVHESADKNSPHVEKLSRFAQVMEMDIQGEWYEVYVASSDLSGWIHSSMLMLLGADTSNGDLAAPVTLSRSSMSPTRIVKFKLKDSDKTPAMKDFEKYLLKYNARTNVLKGYIPFTKAEPLENGNLQLIVTSAWLKKSKARQRSSLITLYTKWKKAVNNTELRVIAVDSLGNEILHYPK